MKYEWSLARSFMKSMKHKRLYHPHIVLSILGIAVGVSFLIFSLSIYDGYVKKLETIVFSFYPQITIQCEEADNNPEENDFDYNFLLEGKVDDQCHNVCSGSIILEDRTLSQNKQKMGEKFNLKRFQPLKTQLQGIRGIQRISPIIFEEANFSCEYRAGDKDLIKDGPLRVLGLEPQDRGFVPEIERTIKDKKLFTMLAKTDVHYVILSEELYRDLFGAVTDPGKVQPQIISLVLGNGSNGNTHPVEKRRVELKVAGVFRLGMHKISENMMITSLDTAQDILGMKGQASFVGISLQEPYEADIVAEAIKDRTVENEPVVQVYHWKAVAADMFNSLSLYRKIVIVVLLISIIITAFNIYTTLNIMILERKKQIGILMSMGIKKASLHRTFLLISQVEAGIGIGAGVGAGVFFGYYFSDFFNRSLESFLHIQDAGTVMQFGTTLGIAMFVCILSGLTAFLATRKGAKLDPVEALRSE